MQVVGAQREIGWNDSAGLMGLTMQIVTAAVRKQRCLLLLNSMSAEHAGTERRSIYMYVYKSIEQIVWFMGDAIIEKTTE